jgi:hypothetical protein
MWWGLYSAGLWGAEMPQLRVHVAGESPVCIRIYGQAAAAPINVTVILHNTSTVTWCGQGTATSSGDHGVLNISLDCSQLSDEACIELRAEDGSGTALTLDDPFHRLTADGWQLANEEVEVIRCRREAKFNVPVLAGDATRASPVFSGLALIEGLLLIASTRVPGIRIFPLNITLSAQPQTLDLLQRLAAEILGQGQPVEAPGQLGNAQGLPLVALHFPVVHAAAGEAALGALLEQAGAVMDVLSYNRKARRPALVGAAVKDVTSNVIQSWLEPSRTQYIGNLLGGFISGEDHVDLPTQWDRLAADPRLSLWFQQLGDARAERRWEYRILRHFNMLEGMAKGSFGTKLVVTDAAGRPRMVDATNPYTTQHGRGAVYAVIADMARHRGDVDEGMWCSVAPLWEMCDLWKVVRNQVAHSGAWESSPPVSGRSKVVAFLLHHGKRRGVELLDAELQACAEMVIDAVVFRDFLALAN